MAKSVNAEKFTGLDLAQYTCRRYHEIHGIRKVASGNMIRACERLLKELKKEYGPVKMVLAIDHLIGTNTEPGFVSQVGVDRMLTVSVFDISIGQIEEIHWDSAYFARFAENYYEADYFRDWRSLLEDALIAKGDRPVVGEDVYPSWKAVAAKCSLRLDAGCDFIRQRFKEVRATDDQLEEKWIGLKPIPHDEGEEKPPYYHEFGDVVC